jgi:serine/threonine-protein kinase
MLAAADPTEHPSSHRIVGGRYRLEHKLGEGGMGLIFLATDLELERPVAIKLLRQEWLDRSDVATRFYREARTVAQLHGEHVVSVLDVGHDESGTPFIAMEYLEGEDLGCRLEQSGPFDLNMAVGYLLEAIDGLGEAHTKGVNHRDLKHENLFLPRRPSGKEMLKVLDFGISKRENTLQLTQPCVALGSPQ